MGYEVDFLPVRSGGAAISVRWGRPGNYKVLVYDAGTAVSGEQMVAHIEKLYMTSHVDYVVSSHPASDHMGGLAVVLAKLTVGELWMQRPWACSRRLRSTMAPARTLEKLATARGIPVYEPFAGANIGPFVVLSPGHDWYMDALLPAFGAQPGNSPKSAALPFAKFREFVHSLDHWTRRYPRERLRPDAATTAENESSAVLYGEFDGRGVLLTGRAGVRALDAAASFAELLGIDLPSRLCLLQAPNAGSLDHVSTKVLDRIVGQSKPQSQRRYTKSAFISISVDARQRLSRALAEALNRRGAISFVTQGMSLHHWHEMPDRGWYRAKPTLLKI